MSEPTPENPITDDVQAWLADHLEALAAEVRRRKPTEIRTTVPQHVIDMGADENGWAKRRLGGMKAATVEIHWAELDPEAEPTGISVADVQPVRLEGIRVEDIQMPDLAGQQILQQVAHAWPDVWAEYRRTFDRLRLAETQARAVIVEALRSAHSERVATDADGIADALKEFVVRCEERDGKDVDVQARLVSAVLHLRSSSDPDEQRASATFLFGAAGERLHAVLAQLPAHPGVASVYADRPGYREEWRPDTPE